MIMSWIYSVRRLLAPKSLGFAVATRLSVEPVRGGT